MISVTAMLSTPMLTQTTTTPTVVHTGCLMISVTAMFVHTYVDTNNNDTYSSPHAS